LTPSSEKAAAAIFGGTFDPIHRGHVTVAEQSVRLLGLDTLLLVPAGRPPHRVPPGASPEDRLAMVGLAVRGHPILQPSDIEIRRPGPSYTLDTVRALNAEWPGRRWTLLLGWDAARDFGKWASPGEIVSLVDVAVFNRSGEEPPTEDRLREAGLPQDTRLLTVDSPDLSADEIRARLAGGVDVGDDLDPSVLEYIRAHELYRS
jgi:nicotinate-nucleotide adenylyltransferase